LEGAINGKVDRSAAPEQRRSLLALTLVLTLAYVGASKAMR
jgi:hypothetical protein